MVVLWGDYHPYAACLMFKGCGDADTVQKNLQALVDQWHQTGFRDGLNGAKIVLDGMAKKPERFISHKDMAVSPLLTVVKPNNGGDKE